MTVWRSSKYAGFPRYCVGYSGKVQGMGVCLGGVSIVIGKCLAHLPIEN